MKKFILTVSFLLSTLPLAAAEFDFESILVHHLMDDVVVEWQPGGEKVRPGTPEYANDPYRRFIFKDAEGLYKYQGGLPLHLTRRVFMLFVASGTLIVLMVLAARAIARDPFQVKGGFVSLAESMIEFVREDVISKNMHGHGKGFEPYILSLFFFILFSNLFGLIPPPGEFIVTVQTFLSGHAHAHPEVGETTGLIPGVWSGMTATGDIAVTAALATITTLLIWITGFRYQGIHFLWSFMPAGLNPIMFVILYPMLFVLEFVVGPLAKGFALTVRLLANMTAGHIIILALLGFIFQFGVFVSAIAVPGAAAILMLELFVCFLQAFIFSLLTAIFVGGSMHAH